MSGGGIGDELVGVHNCPGLEAECDLGGYPGMGELRSWGVRGGRWCRGKLGHASERGVA